MRRALCLVLWAGVVVPLVWLVGYGFYKDWFATLGIMATLVFVVSLPLAIAFGTELWREP